MEERGDDPKEIYLATGWERGVDGKWRYDLTSDIHYDLDDAVWEKMEEGNWTYFFLDDILLNAEDLFAVYPQLREYKVRRDAWMDSLGVAYPTIKEIWISGNVFSQEQRLSVLLHEIQHAIQHIEGFSNVSYDAKYKNLFEEKQEVLKQLRKLHRLYPVSPSKELLDLKQRLKSLDNSLFQRYQRSAAEVEARNVETRLTLTPEQRKQILISETEDVPRDQQIIPSRFLSARDLTNANPMTGTSIMQPEEIPFQSKIVLDEKTIREVFEHRLLSGRFPAFTVADLVSGQYRYSTKFFEKAKGLVAGNVPFVLSRDAKGAMTQKQKREYGYALARFEKATTYQDYLYALKKFETLVAEMRPDLRDVDYMRLRGKMKGRPDYAVLEPISGYLDEELMPQKVSEMIMTSHQRMKDELYPLLKQHNLSAEDAVVFAMLMTAPERNFQIAQVNEEFGNMLFAMTDDGPKKLGAVFIKPEGGGSGISTEAAIFGGEATTEYGESFPINGLLKHFAEVSVIIRDIEKGTQRVAVAKQGSMYSDLKLNPNEIVSGIDVQNPLSEGLWKSHQWLMDMLARNRENAVRFGLISNEDKNIMEETYKYYFPLRNLDDIQYAPLHGELSNFSEWTRRATGRTTMAGPSLEFAMSLYDATVKKGHQNMVVEKVAQLLLLSPDKNWDNLVDMTDDHSDPSKILIPLKNIKGKITGYQSKTTIKKNHKGRITEEPFFTINQVTSKATISKSGMVKRVADTSVQKDPRRSIAFKKNGDTVTLTLNYPALARAVNHLASRNIQGIIDPWYNQTITSSGLAEDMVEQFREGNPWSKAMRFFGQSYTSWSPLFLVYNAQRDASTGLINLFGEHIQGARMSAKALKALGVIGPIIPLSGLFSPAALAVGRHLAGKPDLTNEYDRYYEEMNKVGGMISFYGSESATKLMQELREIESPEGAWKGLLNLPGKVVGKVFGGVADALANQNSKIELATRLAAYVAARQTGYTPVRAASIAKNITVNFNRRGMGGTPIYEFMRQSYLFFNANIQGIARWTQASTFGKIRKLVYPILTMLAVAAAEWSRMMGGEDDDGRDRWDHMDDTQKERNLLIYLPFLGKNYYWGIKLPFGHGLAFQLGYGIDDIIHYYASGGKKGKSPDVVAWNLIDAALSFVDIAGTGVSLGDSNKMDLGYSFLTMLTPSILRPAVSLAINRDYNGNPIKPIYEKAGPAYLTTYGRAGVISDFLAENANKMRWDDARLTEKPRGVLSNYLTQWSPDEVRYLLDNGFSGVGKLITEFAEMAIRGASIVSGETPEYSPRISEISFSRALILEGRDRLTQDQFYKYKDFMQTELNKLVELSGDKGQKRYSPFLNLKPWFNSRVREIDKLSSKIKEAKGKQEVRTDLIEQRRQLMLKVNMKLEEARRISDLRP